VSPKTGVRETPRHGVSGSRINVKVRLHRARGLVRQHFYKVIGNTAAQAFPFHLDRCNDSKTLRSLGGTHLLYIPHSQNKPIMRR
jgi:hypothetical protein